jgi:hypothetical protein
MSGGILVSFKSSQPTVYLIGIFLFLALGIVLAGLGFGGVAGGTGLGIMGIVIAVGAVVLLIEYLATK